MAKFKIGDLIRITNIKDPAYKYHNIYEVVEYENGYYGLKSLQTHSIVYPINFGIDVEKHYRLLTKTEKVLYGRPKNIQKDV